MNVTLRQLRAFVAVADAQHFTRAAERLVLSQSTVSTLVRELEDNLGLKLFDRHTRMLRLTHAGAELLPLARRALADLDDVLGSSAELRTLGRGRVSIAEATDITGANRNTVKVHLRKLTEAGHLAKHGAGKSVWYVLA